MQCLSQINKGIIFFTDVTNIDICSKTWIYFNYIISNTDPFIFYTGTANQFIYI
jgi:hypothetical protein